MNEDKKKRKTRKKTKLTFRSEVNLHDKESRISTQNRTIKTATLRERERKFEVEICDQISDQSDG